MKRKGGIEKYGYDSDVGCYGKIGLSVSDGKILPCDNHNIACSGSTDYGEEGSGAYGKVASFNFGNKANADYENRLSDKTDKKRKRCHRGGMFAVIVIALCFIVTIVACGILNGGILNAISYGDSYKKFYLLSMESFDDLDLARQAGIINKKRGGAGYVLKYDESYKLIAAIYDSKEDAERVLSKQEEGTSLIEISISPFSGLENWHSRAKSALGTIVKCYESLNDIIIKNASGEMSETEAKNKLLVLIGAIAKTQTEFAKVAKSENALNFDSKLSATLSMLEELREKTFSLGSVRFTQIAVVVLFCN